MSKTLIKVICGHPYDKFATFAGLMCTNQFIHVYIIHAMSCKLDHEYNNAVYAKSYIHFENNAILFGKFMHDNV